MGPEEGGRKRRSRKRRRGRTCKEGKWNGNGKRRK